MCGYCAKTVEGDKNKIPSDDKAVVNFIRENSGTVNSGRLISILTVENADGSFPATVSHNLTI
jgi:hypothetical protein